MVLQATSLNKARKLGLGAADSIIFQNAAHNENMLVASQNGAVSLYYDNSKKLETTSSGVTITGDITANNLAVANTPVVSAYKGSEQSLLKKHLDKINWFYNR